MLSRFHILPACDGQTDGRNCYINIGSELSWVDKIRYLGVFVTRSRKFKCSIDNAKRSFHRAANGIFGKVGRL